MSYHVRNSSRVTDHFLRMLRSLRYMSCVACCWKLRLTLAMRVLEGAVASCRRLAVHPAFQNIVTRVRTGPILGFGPAGFLLTRTGTGPFFEPALLTYSCNKFQIRVLRRQARVMPPLVRRGCKSCVMKQHCYAAFEVCRRPATGENELRRSGARSKNRRPLFACLLTELSGHE